MAVQEQEVVPRARALQCRGWLSIQEELAASVEMETAWS